MSSSAQRITEIERITNTNGYDTSTVYFTGSGTSSALSTVSLKNSMISTNLSIGPGVLRLALGCVIENSITNSLETIEAWLNGDGNVQNMSIKWDYANRAQRRDPIYYQSYRTTLGPGYRTDVRDLSYYFIQINGTSKLMTLGKYVRGRDIIFGQKRVSSISNPVVVTSNQLSGQTVSYSSDLGKLTFSCYQTGGGTVTISARVGTPYSSLPYTILEATDTNNFLASKESFGRFGVISGGGSIGRDLIVCPRSKSDKFITCESAGDVYSWEGAGSGGTTNPVPDIEDPTPPQPGEKTVISNIGGVELSYDNDGEHKDLLRVNNILIGSTYDVPNRSIPKVNRFDLIRSGWAAIAAVSDSRISSQALQTGGNNTIPRTIILRNLNTNYITFWRMGIARVLLPNIPDPSWYKVSADGSLGPNSTQLYNVETILNFDLNKDSKIGDPTISVPPPAPNTTNISTVGDVVLSYNTSGTNKDLLRVADNYIKDQYGNNINYFQYINSGYEPVGAATINDTNYLVFKTPSNGIPFSAGAVEVVADRPLFSNDRSQVTDTGTVTSIPIKFTVPVTEFSLANNIVIYRNGVIAPALKNVASLSGSGMSYTLTIPSGTSTNGVYEIRILNYNRTSGLYITGIVNGQPVTMKQNANIYWGKGVGSTSTNSPTAKSLTLWKMSSTWTFDSVNAVHAPLSAEYYQAESNFVIDFDKDGIIGNPNNPVLPPSQLTTIENSGNTILSYDQNDHLVANSTLIIVDGSPVKRTNSSWDHLVAENISGTNYLLSRSKTTGGCRIVRLDTNWRSISTDPIVSPNTEEFFSTEILFNTDIDNNGLIGKPLSPVILKSMKNTALVLSYDRQGSDAYLLKANGSLVKSADNENVNIPNYRLLKWRPIAIGVVNGVNTIVWRQIDNKYLHFWRLDNSWKQVSSDGYFAPNSVGLYDAEVTFGIDFNGDGKIGSPTTTTQPSTSPALTNIENSGSVTLAYNRDNILTANGTIVKINNIPLKRTGTDWVYLAAENIDGTNMILQQSRTSGYLNFLEFDNSWNSTSNRGWYAPGSADFYAIELMFQKDVDNNGNTGPILSLTSNFEETLQAFGNQTLSLGVSLNTNLSQSDTTIRYEWEYDTGSGWTDWTLPQTDTFKSSFISVVFLPTYTTLKVRCKTTVLFAPDSLALDVFGGNFELMSKELVVTKKAETNYVVVRSPVPFTFTYDRGSSFNLDTIPRYIQDSIAMISGGDLPSDYLTGIPSSWTPLCGPLETDNCATYRQAQNDGIYGTRLLKSGLTYTIYPKTLSFRPFLIDFENLS